MYQASKIAKIAETKILNILNKGKYKIYLPCWFYEDFI